MTNSVDAIPADGPTPQEGPSPDSVYRAVVQAAVTVPRPAVDLLERLAERVSGKASVVAVFGEPTGHDGVTVIPVASIAFGFGGRSGAATGSRRGDEGGGGGTARPIGFIEISGGVAVFRPIRDPLRDFAAPLAALLSATVGIRFRRRKNAA